MKISFPVAVSKVASSWHGQLGSPEKLTVAAERDKTATIIAVILIMNDPATVLLISGSSNKRAE